MPVFLEVIVTSVAEALAAEKGGADRLELVRALDQGGLTPAVELVESVTSTVSIPVRVMIREAELMRITGTAERLRLQRSIHELSQYPIDGFVLGFLQQRAIDTATLDELLPPDLHCRVTFHRAFDETADPFAALAALKQYPQVDRILTSAAEGSWLVRRAQLDRLRASAAPAMEILFAIGLDTAHLAELHQSPQLYEVHVGRAARSPHTNAGTVSPDLIAALKRNHTAKPVPETTPGTAPEVGVQ